MKTILPIFHLWVNKNLSGHEATRMLNPLNTARGLAVHVGSSMDALPTTVEGKHAKRWWAVPTLHGRCKFNVR